MSRYSSGRRHLLERQCSFSFEVTGIEARQNLLTGGWQLLQVSASHRFPVVSRCDKLSGVHSSKNSAGPRPLDAEAPGCDLLPLQLPNDSAGSRATAL